MTRRDIIKSSAGILAAAIVTAIVVHFHDRFWWPPDDGAYAYIAQRLLQGSVLGRDIHDIHGGYVHFIHAGAMLLFGEDLVSLRYPLAILTVGQSVLVYLLLISRGVYPAFVGAVACGAFSYVQFLNPSANWYIPPVAVLIIAVLAWVKPDSRLRLPAIGFLLMIGLLLRQLSGVFLIIATVSWLLLDYRNHHESSPRLAKAILVIFGIIIAAYVWSKQSIGAVLMFGVWPLSVLFFIWRNVRIPDGAATRILAGLTLGAAAASLPMFAYHIVHGTVIQWFSDAFLDALRFGSMAFLFEQSFGVLLVQVLGLSATQPSNTGILNGVFWILLLFLPTIVGCQFLLRSFGTGEPSRWPPAVILAIFYALVSVHYQISIYLMYSTFLSVLGLLFLVRPGIETRIAGSVVLALSATAIFYHAGQPVSRGLDGVILGKVMPLDGPDGLPHASVAMERHDVETYTAILDIIAEYTGPEDKILALPFRPEFYFLSKRESVFGFLGVPFGIRNEVEFEAALDKLSSGPPKVIINNREDKYHTKLSRKLLESIAGKYVLLKSINGFDVYRLK